MRDIRTSPINRTRNNLQVVLYISLLSFLIWNILQWHHDSVISVYMAMAFWYASMMYTQTGLYIVLPEL